MFGANYSKPALIHRMATLTHTMLRNHTNDNEHEHDTGGDHHPDNDHNDDADGNIEWTYNYKYQDPTKTQTKRGCAAAVLKTSKTPKNTKTNVLSKGALFL